MTTISEFSGDFCRGIHEIRIFSGFQHYWVWGLSFEQNIHVRMQE